MMFIELLLRRFIYVIFLITNMLVYFFQLLYYVSAGDLDAMRTFGQVCEAHGYNFEAHNVTTSDGYILTLFRIPSKKGQPFVPGKPVVFLQHGLFDLADTWIMDIPCPGFLFSDAGFDVWFGNSRGSYHSLGHTKWDYKTDPQYWQFTWQHMADFDIPSAIPFVLQQTNKQKLTYIGHSQGTLQMFAHLSSDPTFMQYLNIFIALAPVGTVRHMEIPFFSILEKFPLIKALEDKGVYEFLPNTQSNLEFYEVCHTFGKVCDDLLWYFADMQVANDNEQRLPTIIAHEPGGTSTLNTLHWQQMTNYWTNKVQKFDYGNVGNLANYGQSNPPLYDFSKVPPPVALFSGNEDRLADVRDVQWLESVLPQESVVYNKQLNGFGHATFIWGNAESMQYFQDVIALANQYSDL